MGEGVVVEGCPDVLVDANGLIGSPKETAAEEGDEEQDAVVPLGEGAGHAEFIEEPVEIEEGGGEFVEDECWAVEVHEGALVTPLLAMIALELSNTGGGLDRDIENSQTPMQKRPTPKPHVPTSPPRKFPHFSHRFPSPTQNTPSQTPVSIPRPLNNPTPSLPIPSPTAPHPSTSPITQQN